MARYVQVKVKVDGDGLRWEDRDIVAEFMVSEMKDPHNGSMVWMHNMSGMTLTEKVQDIAKSFPHAVEARWNWKESLQGHYNMVGSVTEVNK